MYIIALAHILLTAQLVNFKMCVRVRAFCNSAPVAIIGTYLLLIPTKQDRI